MMDYGMLWQPTTEQVRHDLDVFDELERMKD